MKSAFQTQIEALKSEIAGLDSQAEAILETANAREDKATTEDEQGVFDTIMGQQIPALEQRIANLEAQESAQARRAAPVQFQNKAGTELVKTAEADNRKGMLFAVQAHALYVQDGSRAEASRYLRGRGYDLAAWTLEQPRGSVEAALDNLQTAATVAPGDTTTTGWAAELVNVKQDADDFRELLRPQTIIGRIPGQRRLTFEANGSMKVKGQTAGVSGAWIGEGDAIPLEALAFDDITLTPKKRATIVAVNNELMRRGTPSALELIRDDMVEGIARGLDATFQGNAAASSTAPAGIFNGVESTGTVGGGYAALDNDLKGLITGFAISNVGGANRAWVMPEQSKIAIQFMRDANGNVIYPSVAESNTLLGYPIVSSSAVTAATIGLIEGSSLIVADELMPTISISEDATLSMRTDPASNLVAENSATPPVSLSTPVRSMFQTDSVAIRIVTAMDWGMRHGVAVDRLTATSWS
ncbi:MAG: phage major capsid protein [Gammaproteobacteria bacterium]|nr:phage major capsid protein [Gammaproteobacteria bacterium]